MDTSNGPGRRPSNGNSFSTSRSEETYSLALAEGRRRRPLTGQSSSYQSIDHSIDGRTHSNLTRAGARQSTAAAAAVGARRNENRTAIFFLPPCRFRRRSHINKYKTLMLFTFFGDYFGEKKMRLIRWHLRIQPNKKKWRRRTEYFAFPSSVRLPNDVIAAPTSIFRNIDTSIDLTVLY